MNNILELLEHTAAARPNKTAVIDENGTDRFDTLLDRSRRCGTALAAYLSPTAPVPVLLDKSREALYAFFGAAYAGCFYVPLSPALPQPRLAQILSVLQAPCIVTDREHAALAAQLPGAGTILLVEELLQTQPDDALLARIRRSAIDCDRCTATSPLVRPARPRA